MDFCGQASARTAYGLVDAFLLTRPGAVLMRSDDGGVDHGVLVVGIIGQRLEKTLPNPFDQAGRRRDPLIWRRIDRFAAKRRTPPTRRLSRSWRSRRGPRTPTRSMIVRTRVVTAGSAGS